MTHHLLRAVLLLAAALVPFSVPAADLEFSEVDLSTFAGFTTQLQPAKSDSDFQTAPYRDVSVISAKSLVLAGSIPFPNVPTSQTQAFASAAVNNFGFIGVGVSGFFFQNSLPKNELTADASGTLTVFNSSTESQSLLVDFLIPAPTFRFFGIGNSLPPDPARDVAAVVSARMLSTITHADGSVEPQHTALDYGMTLFRDPNFGPLFAIPTADASGKLTRFDEPDGSFGFQLEALVLTDFFIAEFAPGDTIEFTFDYLASASTGFGETGIFAAIGDPLDLTTGGGHFDIHVDAPTSIPEPSTWALLATGLMALRFAARAAAQRRFA
jgi:PEP-CTERM motif